MNFRTADDGHVYPLAHKTTRRFYADQELFPAETGTWSEEEQAELPGGRRNLPFKARMDILRSQKRFNTVVRNDAKIDSSRALKVPTGEPTREAGIDQGQVYEDPWGSHTRKAHYEKPGFEVSSPMWSQGEIPDTIEAVKNPMVEYENVPKGTKSLAFIVRDLGDASTEEADSAITVVMDPADHRFRIAGTDIEFDRREEAVGFAKQARNVNIAAAPGVLHWDVYNVPVKPPGEQYIKEDTDVPYSSLPNYEGHAGFAPPNPPPGEVHKYALIGIALNSRVQGTEEIEKDIERMREGKEPEHILAIDAETAVYPGAVPRTRIAAAESKPAPQEAPAMPQSQSEWLSKLFPDG